jgi:hypothetical protein
LPALWSSPISLGGASQTRADDRLGKCGSCRSESYLQNPRGKQANGNWIKYAALSIAARRVTLIGIQDEKQYGNRKKLMVKQHICEIALQSILKLKSGALPRLAIATVFEGLVVASGSAQKPSDAPENLSHVPVPLKLTVCGLPGSLSAMTRVVDRAPAPVGLNARLIVHLPSAATLLPTAQVELDSIAKSRASVPLRVRLSMRSGVLPRLVSVTVFGALVVSTRWGPKPRDVAESRTAVPVPLKLTVCGLLGSLSAMTRVANCTPAAVGLNAKLIAQLPSPATLPPATHELD